MITAGDIDPSRHGQNGGRESWPIIVMTLGEAMLEGFRIDGPFAPTVPFPEGWERAVETFDAGVVSSRQGLGVEGGEVDPLVDMVMTRYGAKTPAQAISGLVNDGQAPFEIGERSLSVEPDGMWDKILERAEAGADGATIMKDLSLSGKDFLNYCRSMQTAFGCEPNLAALMRSAYVFGLRSRSLANEQTVLVDNNSTVLTLPPRPIPSITEREREVITERSFGHNNKEVGRELYVSEDTVKTHLRRVNARLGAHEFTEAFAKYVILGVIACERQSPLGRGLAPREREVLVGVTVGKTNLEIGKELGVSEDTIKTHVRRILAKTDAKNRGHAARRAFEIGLVVAGRPARPRANASS
jgi:DNA-binding CsgD family transcriptional regulator